MMSCLPGYLCRCWAKKSSMMFCQQTPDVFIYNDRKDKSTMFTGMCVCVDDVDGRISLRSRRMLLVVVHPKRSVRLSGTDNEWTRTSTFNVLSSEEEEEKLEVFFASRSECQENQHDFSRMMMKLCAVYSSSSLLRTVVVGSSDDRSYIHLRHSVAFSNATHVRRSIDDDDECVESVFIIIEQECCRQ